MYNVGITGSSGFVGTNLINYLKSFKFRLTPISRTQLKDIENFQLDCDVIVHLAGKAHDLKKTANPDEYYQVNFEHTKRLYDRFLRSDAKKFIFISSVKAAADVVDGVLTEELESNPLTHYGKSKLMAEDYIRSQILPIGKSYYILRPCMIHGPGNKGNLNLLYNVVKKGIPYPLAAFDNQRSFLSIANLNYIIEQLISKPDIPGGVYNIADDEALSTNHVIRIINEAIGRKSRLWRVNKKLLTGIATIGDYLHLPLNSERLKKLTESYVVSNDKIKQALKLVALPVSSSEGLIITAKSFESP